MLGCLRASGAKNISGALFCRECHKPVSAVCQPVVAGYMTFSRRYSPVHAISARETKQHSALGSLQHLPTGGRAEGYAPSTRTLGCNSGDPRASSMHERICHSSRRIGGKVVALLPSEENTSNEGPAHSIK